MRLDGQIEITVQRHRHRHPAGGPGEDLRGVPAGRPRRDEARRDRAGPDAVAQDRRAARRAHLGGERGRAVAARSGSRSRFAVRSPTRRRPLPQPCRPADRGASRATTARRSCGRGRRALDRAAVAPPERRGLRGGGRPRRPAGLELARELRPAGIVLDIMLPELDGWDVLAAVEGGPEVADDPGDHRLDARRARQGVRARRRRLPGQAGGARGRAGGARALRAHLRRRSARSWRSTTTREQSSCSRRRSRTEGYAVLTATGGERGGRAGTQRAAGARPARPADARSRRVRGRRAAARGSRHRRRFRSSS